ncbi:SigE family RNA polymerase sigma factor [Yinghuangia sp. YIM S09857]|uniref:SigE family RNA polymerase sigma factor n=1 Tax=Yinghuangia sp. YIM S09857 TaxID=3436929 RepID=UPI003F5385A4
MGFDEFAAARLPALLRYAFVLCGDRELARDMTQEVLARALVKWPRIERTDRPDAYVRTMLTNEFLSLRRRKAVATVAMTYEHLDGPGAPAVDAAHAISDRAELWQHLGRLPRRQRAVLVLRYYEDLSDIEIADVLGCRPSTVRSHATRALATLRVGLTNVKAPVLAVRDGDGS